MPASVRLTEFWICRGIVVWMRHVGQVAAADGVELVRHGRVLPLVFATEAQESRHVEPIALYAQIGVVSSW